MVYDNNIALMWAATHNKNPQTITDLIKAGADVNILDKGGCTPLIVACMFNRNPEIVTALLDNGADANIRNNFGLTAWDHIQNNRRLVGTEAYDRLKALQD